MSVETVSQLPQAIYLNGNELFLISQQGSDPVPRITKSVPLDLLYDYLANAPGVTNVTMRQLVAAMASENLLLEVLSFLSGDVTNSYNIAYNHASRMPITDPFVTGFLEVTVGLTSSQITALFALALTFPA